MNWSQEDLVNMSREVGHWYLEEAPITDLRILAEDLYGALTDEEAATIYELVTAAEVHI